MKGRGRWLPGLGLGILAALTASGALIACSSQEGTAVTDLRSRIETLVRESGQEVAVYYEDLAGGDTLLINADLRMHAASTMKVPVMVRLFLDHENGLLSLDDSLEVTTTFHSIVDGSPYTLEAESDSDSTLYALDGQWVGYRDLVELMITVSSNLATNILIREAGAERVTETMRSLGADSIVVLRGVEDIPAFQAGLSNTTTARDLGILMAALGRGEVGSPALSRDMVDVLSRQQWQTKIPAQLPPEARVAHKTGRITGISHDAGLVFPPDRSPYAVVILTRGFQDPDEADALAARISRMIYDAHLS